MTTIRERSTAALAEALDLSDAIFATWRDREEFTKHIADRLLAASPTLARRLDLATAWDEAVAALPEGWFIFGVRLFRVTVDAERYRATAYSETHQTGREDGYGPTPTEALVALAEALRERAR